MDTQKALERQVELLKERVEYWKEQTRTRKFIGKKRLVTIGTAESEIDNPKTKNRRGESSPVFGCEHEHTVKDQEFVCARSGGAEGNRTLCRKT